MAPAGEAGRHIGPHRQHQHHRRGRGGHRQDHRGEAARAQERDNQERDEEHQRRAEIPHQRQRADAHGGKADEQQQVPPSEKPVQGGGAGVNIRDLYKFRGLQGVPRHDQPVFRPENGGAQHQRQGQQAHGDPPGGPARGADPLQVPEPEAQQEKGRQRRDQQRGLFPHGAGGGGGSHGKAHGGEEKAQELRLEAPDGHAALQRPAGPFRRYEHHEGQDHRQQVLLRDDGGELGEQRRLEHRQEHQRAHGRGAPAAPAPGGGLRLHGEKAQRHAAHPEPVALFDGRFAGYGLAAHHRARAAAHIGQRPGPVPRALEGGVAPGHGGVGHHHVRGAGASDDALPMPQLGLLAAGELHPAPQLAPGLPQQHGHGAAKRDPQRQCGQDAAGIVLKQDGRKAHGELLCAKVQLWVLYHCSCF